MAEEKMSDKIVVDTIGKITSINTDKRIMWVKDNEAVTFELKWLAVMDDVCRKQKNGYRVKVTTTKNLHDDVPQFWITAVVFDETYKKGKGAYAPSPEEQKLIVLQSCQRTGAMVLVGLISKDNIRVHGTDDFFIIFNNAMDKIRDRAIADAAAFQAEAKKP